MTSFPCGAREEEQATNYTRAAFQSQEVRHSSKHRSPFRRKDSRPMNFF